MSTADSPPPPTSSSSSGRTLGLPSPGEVLAGKYSVEAVLGVGGMAVVVAARHLELDERVALKILLPKYRSNEEIVARFRREARAAVKIKSEHVARVHDVGTLDDGAPCLVMEYLDGLDLESVLDDQGPLKREDAVDYILEACEALAEAHSLGVVHRDLKPANLFLSQRADGKPSIKLLDFGISKVAGVAGRGLTRKKSSFGTPHYMSPEQLRATEDVDPRADVWSMGAILQELISGDPPFDADDLTELQALIKSAAPRPLREGAADAPQALQAVVLRCLAKDPDKRFQTVADLATALAPFGSARAPALAESVGRVAAATLTRAAVVDAQALRPPTPIAFTPVGVPATRSSGALPAAPSSGSSLVEPAKLSTKTSIAVESDADLPFKPRSRARGVVVALLVAVPLVGAGLLGARALGVQLRPAPSDTSASLGAVPASPEAAPLPAPSAGASVSPPTAEAPSAPSAVASGAAKPRPGMMTNAKTKAASAAKRKPAGKAGDQLFDDRK